MTGQHALVTGAARGIGAAICERLAHLGASLTLVGRTRETLLERAGALSERYDISIHLAVADVAQPEEIVAAFDSASSEYGPISILVNNAGTARAAPFQRTDRALWDTMLGVNLTGVFNCTQAVLPDMLEAGYGRVINVASTAGLKGYAYVTAYCAAKHGVVGMTRALALETATRGVTVNAVCPGYTDTDLVSDAIEVIVAKTGRSSEDAVKELAAGNPQKRLILPEEVADAVAWLALPATAAVNGVVLPVAGGEVS